MQLDKCPTEDTKKKKTKSFLQIFFNVYQDPILNLNHSQQVLVAEIQNLNPQDHLILLNTKLKKVIQKKAIPKDLKKKS